MDVLRGTSAVAWRDQRIFKALALQNELVALLLRPAKAYATDAALLGLFDGYLALENAIEQVLLELCIFLDEELFEKRMITFTRSDLWMWCNRFSFVEWCLLDLALVEMLAPTQLDLLLGQSVQDILNFWICALPKLIFLDTLIVHFLCHSLVKVPICKLDWCFISFF
jgi:hypothetical protein